MIIKKLKELIEEEEEEKEKKMEQIFHDSKDCEVAIVHDKLGFCTKSFIDSADSVIGFITPDELPELMMKVKEAENIEL